MDAPADSWKLSIEFKLAAKSFASRRTWHDRLIKLFFSFFFVFSGAGVMQATNSGTIKLDKRYSPNFQDERNKLAPKRKRDSVLKMKVHKRMDAEIENGASLPSDSANRQCILLNHCNSINKLIDLEMGRGKPQVVENFGGNNLFASCWP